MPADHGLSSLGLLLQLWGAVGVILAAGLAVPAALHDATGTTFFLVAFTGVRAAFHRAAGTALLYGTGASPMRGVLTYIWVALCHSIIALLFLDKFGDPALLARAAAVLLAWPLTLLVVVLLPRIRPLLRAGVPVPEDQSLEGAAVLMCLCGVLGVLLAAGMLAWMMESMVWSQAGTARHALASMAGMLVAIALLVRSAIHARTGFQGVSGASFEQHNAGASRYCSLGLGSAIGTGATVLLSVTALTSNLGLALLVGGVSTALLWAWPSIVSRLYAERNFDVYLAGGSPPRFHRAPDTGLIALGWVLLAAGVLTLSQAAAKILLTGELFRMLPHDSAGRLPIQALLAGGLALWAGIELVRMSDRYRQVAMIYGIAGVMLAVDQFWQLWQLLPMLERARALAELAMLHKPAGLSVLTAVLSASIELVLAAVTLALVRRIMLPRAIARIRPRNARAGAASGVQSSSRHSGAA